MSQPQHPAQRRSSGVVAIALIIGILACTLQANAQIVASKTRDLTPQEQKSAIAFTGEKPKEVMAVKGTVATFSRSGMQAIGAQIVWNDHAFSEGLCLAPVANLSAYRKVGVKTIPWKLEQSSSHHLPPGSSYFVWVGRTEKDCKTLPQTDLISLAAPIPTPALKRLIKYRYKIKALALPLLRMKEKEPPDGHNKKLISGMKLKWIDLDFDWKRGFVYALRYDKKYAMLVVHVDVNGTLPVAFSAQILLP